MSRSIFIESPKGSAGERQFAEVEDGQRALRVWNVCVIMLREPMRSCWRTLFASVKKCVLKE